MTTQATAPIWIGNDHGGYELKLNISAYLEQNGIAVVDVGCDFDRDRTLPALRGESGRGGIWR